MDIFLSQLRGPEVTVRVGQGDQARDFVVAKSLLCAKNKWFESALKEGHFLESLTGIINLPDDTPAAFEAFYYHLIADHLQLPRVTCKEESKVQSSEQLELLFEICIFGDKYGDQKLQDAAFGVACGLLTFSTWTQWAIESRYVLASFSKTSDYSPLRAVVADYVASRMANSLHTAGQLLHGLSPYPGFAASLQESQNLMHSATGGNFPRYFEPKKHFAQAARAATKDDKGPPEMLRFFAGWQSKEYRCAECGYQAQLQDTIILGCGCHGADAEEYGCSAKPLCKICECLAHTVDFSTIPMD